MEIIQITPTTYRFKDCECSECYYRFSCWTSQSSCCPLKAVRIIDFGDNHLPMMLKRGQTQINIETNVRLGKFDQMLLTRIGKDLVENYENQRKN